MRSSLSGDFRVVSECNKYFINQSCSLRLFCAAKTSGRFQSFGTALTSGIHTISAMIVSCTSGADPGEVKRVNFHPPFSEPPSFFFFLIPQILIGSNTLFQKFTPHLKILDPRLYMFQLMKFVYLITELIGITMLTFHL